MHRLARCSLGAIVAAFVASCASTASPIVVDSARVSKPLPQPIGTSGQPHAEPSQFSAALHCMDQLFNRYGVRDVGILIEDIPNGADPSDRGIQEAIVAAALRMSRTSNGIVPVVSRARAQTVSSNALIGGGKSVRRASPEFTLRASASPFGGSIVHRQGIGGVQSTPNSAAARGSGTVLSLRANLVNTVEKTQVPGAVSNQSALVIRRGTGTQTEVTTRQFGRNVRVELNTAGAADQAWRMLAESVAIELFGRLTRVPYWDCLEVDHTEPLVQAQMGQWWETLTRDRGLLIAYFQRQMSVRGLYESGPSAVVNAQFLAAISAYQAALGLPASATLNEPFFRHYLNANHEQVALKAQQILKLQTTPPATIAPDQLIDPRSAEQRLGLGIPYVHIVGLQGLHSWHQRGQPFSVDVVIDQDAFLYCYLRDEYDGVQQFFPSGDTGNARLSGGSRISFPGDLPFELIASPQGGRESIVCFAAVESLGDQPLKGITRVKSDGQLRDALNLVGGSDSRIGMGVYEIRIR